MILKYDHIYEKPFRRILDYLRITDGQDYTEQYFRFDNYLNCETWLYIINEQVGAYLSVYKDGEDYEVYNIYVHPFFRGQEIAKKLYEQMLSEIKGRLIFSNVHKENKASQKLHTDWERIEFEYYIRFFKKLK